MWLEKGVSRVILGTVAKLDGAKIGCPLLTFVHVMTEGWGISEPILALRELADVEEIHTAAGDACLAVCRVRLAAVSEPCRCCPCPFLEGAAKVGGVTEPNFIGDIFNREVGVVQVF